MRLLNSTTLELHEFFSPAIPPYAILSHRWGDSEISFQQLQDRAPIGSSRVKSRKLIGCCSQAVKDELGYVVGKINFLRLQNFHMSPG